jgi:hypothetical protein
LQSYGENLATILAKLRHAYNGTLVLVTYYAPTPALIPVAQALNSVMVDVGSSFGAKIAKGFEAFQLVSALHGGDPCAAGLLIELSDGTCDVHPTLAGQGLLAAAVVRPAAC